MASLTVGEAVEKLLSHRAVQIAEDKVVRLGDADLIAGLAEVAFTAVGNSSASGRPAPPGARRFSAVLNRAASATSPPKNRTSTDAIRQTGKADGSLVFQASPQTSPC